MKKKNEVKNNSPRHSHPLCFEAIIHWTIKQQEVTFLWVAWATFCILSNFFFFFLASFLLHVRDKTFAPKPITTWNLIHPSDCIENQLSKILHKRNFETVSASWRCSQAKPNKHCHKWDQSTVPMLKFFAFSVLNLAKTFGHVYLQLMLPPVQVKFCREFQIKTWR